jgi:hypothetical protein
MGAKNYLSGLHFYIKLGFSYIPIMPISFSSSEEYALVAFGGPTLPNY